MARLTVYRKRILGFSFKEAEAGFPWMLHSNIFIQKEKRWVASFNKDDPHSCPDSIFKKEMRVRAVPVAIFPLWRGKAVVSSIAGEFIEEITLISLKSGKKT